jgi:pyruvate dehydrogenase E1 component alpha subunit
MNTLSRDTLIELYRTMLRIRLFEEKVVELYPAQEMMTPVHLYIGQEAIATGVVSNLKKKDYVFSNHRSHGHCIAKGTGFKSIMAELYGKKTGCSGGKGGSMHLVDVERGILGTSAIVGGTIPMAVGTALASQMKGDGLVTVVFFGDGATDEGVFHESLNFASLKKLPVVFVCENNFYATNSPLRARHSTCHIAGSAPAYEMPGVCVDGNDVLLVYKEARSAVKRARTGGGPTLIEANTYRWKGHVGPEADFEKGARPKAELLEWMERCPIKRFEEHLLKGSVMAREDMAGTKENIEKELDEAVDFAKKSPWPEAEELTKDLYYEETPREGKER